jgi:hypothetical protein
LDASSLCYDGNLITRTRCITKSFNVNFHVLPIALLMIRNRPHAISVANP